MGRKPVGKVAMTPADRQRLYMQRLKDKAAANGKQSGAQQIVTDEKTRRQMEAMGLSTDIRRKLRRLARHKRCSIAVLVEKWITATENRLAGKAQGRESIKQYYDRE
jgi:hypothetical protein